MNTIPCSLSANLADFYKMFIDNDFPKLLGAELYRPHPAYIVEMASEPVVVHDFTKQPK